jgi:hypothetical protein
VFLQEEVSCVFGRRSILMKRPVICSLFTVVLMILLISVLISLMSTEVGLAISAISVERFLSDASFGRFSPCNEVLQPISYMYNLRHSVYMVIS